MPLFLPSSAELTLCHLRRSAKPRVPDGPSSTFATLIFLCSTELPRLQVDEFSVIRNVSAEDLAAATAHVSDDDFEALLHTEGLGQYFRREEEKRLVLNARMQAFYPEK